MVAFFFETTDTGGASITAAGGFAAALDQQKSAEPGFAKWLWARATCGGPGCGERGEDGDGKIVAMNAFRMSW